MWNRDRDSGKWVGAIQSTEKDIYDNYKQDQIKVRLYSKCLSGAVFSPTDNVDDIYGISKYSNKKSWYYGTNSPYSIQELPNKELSVITPSNISEYKSYMRDYGMTIKNLFTTKKLIGCSFLNFYEVDLITTNDVSSDLMEMIIDSKINLVAYVDGVRLINGHRVLVKDMKTTIFLAPNVDPNTFFKGNFYKIDNVDPNINEYEYLNEYNGVYEYTNGLLLKTNMFEIYEKSYNTAIVAKLGSNVGKQYHLSRLLNGLFPTDGSPIEFIEGKNWIIRNVFDYNNIFDVVLNQILVSDPKTIVSDGITYSIPKRVLSVGEFGTIINTEYETKTSSNKSHLIKTKFRDTLKSISETNNFYWVCGSNGLLLKIDIITFEMLSYDLNISTTFNKINFYDSMNGVVVGDYGLIFITSNGGETWERQEYREFGDHRLLDVTMYNLSKFFIVGELGLFIEMNISNGKWQPWVKKVIKTIDYYDEYLLYDDITSIEYVNKPIIITGDDGYGLVSPITISDYYVMGTSGDNIIIKCFEDKHEFIFIKFGTITNVRDLQYNSASSVLYCVTDTIQRISLSDMTLNIGSNYCFYDVLNSVNSVLDVYVNSMSLDDNSVYSCGNSSSMYITNLLNTDPSNVIKLDQDYGKYDKSRLLFLDYAIASKLNFFDDNSKYILPSPVSIPIADLTDLLFTPTMGELNWITYYRESVKNFKFYKAISDSNTVRFSTMFSKVNGIYALDNIVEFTSNETNFGTGKCLVTNDYSKFNSLLPNLQSGGSNGFIPKLNRNIYGTFPTTASDSFNSFSYAIMLYGYLMVIKMPSENNTRVGDVFYIDSNYVSTSLVVTYIHSYSGSNYVYFETNFNETMVRDIISSISTLKVVNTSVFSTATKFVENFNQHPLSIAYDVNLIGGEINIKTRFNNMTAYYNLETLITYHINSQLNTKTMKYSEEFTKFGYSPTYNILNYLNNIDNVSFTSDKVLTAMPKYQNLPLNSVTNSTDDIVFIEFSRVKTNIISFGKDLKFEWDTLWIHTFVDLDLKLANVVKVSTEKLLITKKYEENGRYIIEFNKIINFQINDTLFDTVDIKSRNTLGLISEDLQSMNNIHTSSRVKDLGITRITNLENDLSSRFPTDSYCKILLSDFDIKDKVSGIIYTDLENNLAFNVINTEQDTQIVVNNASQLGSNVVFTVETNHGLKPGDYVIVRKNNGYCNSSWLGFTSIVSVINDTTIEINKTWDNPSESGCDAILSYIKNDPFLNYQPVDIMDLGLDIDVKQAIELLPSNIKVTGNVVSLINVNYSKYRYNCVDGLSVSIISEKFPWLLNAEISDAVIGYDQDGLIWYSGDWKCGRWFGNKWHSGRWFGGDWYSGDWNSKTVTIDNYSVSVGKVNDINSSLWFGGRWFGGTWNGGTWNGGRVYDITWNGGIWNGGIWNGGTWNNGTFSGGIWVTGIWNNGIFNNNSKPAYWIGGEWGGGDFENGRWYSGEFSEKNFPSRFGTKSTNTRNSIWDSGNWLGGEFHSNLSTTPSGLPMQSDIHRYSYWKTGTWGGGDFYGGTTYNIRFKGGNWLGGVSDDIEIVNVDSLISNTTIGATNSSNKIILNGVFRFALNDEVTIIGENKSNIGSTDNPITYRVSSCNTDDISTTTLELVALEPCSYDFKVYLLYIKLEYILRMGVVISDSDLYMSFIGYVGVFNVYDFIKSCADGIRILNEIDFNTVTIIINNSITASSVDINLNRNDAKIRLVSKFTNANWSSGVWYNGVFENGTFTGGVWYNGKFNGNWGS